MYSNLLDDLLQLGFDPSTLESETNDTDFLMAFLGARGGCGWRLDVKDGVVYDP